MFMHRILAVFVSLLLTCWGSVVSARNTDGVVDRSGRFVIPAKYERIRYLGHGIFQCYRMRKLSELPVSKNSKLRIYQPLAEPVQFCFIGADGHELPVPIPKSCTMTRVLAPEAEAYNIEHCKQLPATMLIVIRGSHGCGLINGQGKVLLEPKYKSIDGSPARVKAVTLADEQARIFDFSAPSSNRVRPRPPLTAAYERAILRVDRDQQSDQAIVYDFKGSQLFHIPATYHNIQALANGNYLACATTGKIDQLPPPLILDRSGHIIEKLKPGSRVVSANNAIACFVGSPIKTGHLLFYDLSGKLKNDIECCTDRPDFGFGMGVLARKFDFWNTGPHAVVEENGDWIFPFQAASFKVVEPDRIIKTVYQEHFDSEECRVIEGELGRQLRFLLKEYNLIGMPVKKLVGLIGPPTDADAREPDVLRYMLSGFGSPCGNASQHLEFRISDGKITGWRLYSFNSQAQWNEQNTKSFQWK